MSGKEYGKCYLDFADIASGSVLELYMGNIPDKEWGRHAE